MKREVSGTMGYVRRVIELWNWDVCFYELAPTPTPANVRLARVYNLGQNTQYDSGTIVDERQTLYIQTATTSSCNGQVHASKMYKMHLLKILHFMLIYSLSNPCTTLSCTMCLLDE